MITRTQLLIVENEMARLQQRITKLIRETASEVSSYKDVSPQKPHLAAAVRRASLDLSRELVKLRQRAGK